jgi:hypothetical protein
MESGERFIMSMIAISGYKSLMVTVDAVTAKSMEDFGFTDDEIKISDSAHVSVFAKNVRYWYNGDTPTPTTGHPIFVNSERMVRGTRNIRQIKFIAEQGTATIAITLGLFGRVPVPAP